MLNYCVKMCIRHLLLISLIQVALCQRQRICQFSSCYPATGDLLIGRESNLTATSTCGMNGKERYCIVSHLEEDTKCFTCDSRHPFTQRQNNSHRIDNIVSSFRDRHRRWWQAQNGEESVSITLNLEAEFHFTHLIMTFKTFRPRALLVERSYDFGRTWKVYRYFANDCGKIFPGISTGPVRRLSDVICESRYSDVVPATRGEVIFRVLPPNVAISNPYSQEVQNLLKLTNLRVNFTHLHTLGDDLLDQRPDIQEKYYYGMYDMTVRGSCSCYGHAARCMPLPGVPNRRDMVHGKCECQHNTKGVNCETCEDMYQDLPWRPARGKQSSACRKCNCNGHSDKCRFDPSLYESSGKVSGGVCTNCIHNTRGTHCEECAPFYYRDNSRPITDIQGCRHCDCDPNGSLYGGECTPRDDPSMSLVAGSCSCRRNVQGARCDTCKDGYWNMRADNPDGCERCTCNTVGTIGNEGCDKVTGQCQCKRYVHGQECNTCYNTFWGLSANLTDGCQACRCDVGGSATGECDLITGQCECRANIVGQTCNGPESGFYFPGLDHNVYEAEYAKGTGNTLIQVREPLPNRNPTWSGPGFMKVSEGDSIEFQVDGIKLSMYYDIIIRYEPLMPERWDDVRVTVVRPGIVDVNGACANIIPQDDLKPTSLQPGNRYIMLTPRTCLEKGSNYTIKVNFNKYKNNLRTPEATVLIDSIVVIPNIDSIPIFQGEGEPQRMKQDFIMYRCRQYQFGLARGPVPDKCKKFIFSISAVIHSKALECSCELTGSVSKQCNTLGGQCQCKNNVIGRKCDHCAPGTYGFGVQGCIPCNCHPYGARDNNCNKDTGQCVCIPNAFGRSCGECQAGYWRFPQCRPCECNGNADICNNDDGACINCRDNTAGQRCDRCAVNYYGDPRLSTRIPCRECQCPGNQASGYSHADDCSLSRSQVMVCNCRPEYTGSKCESCIDNYYGNPLEAGGSCQPCICNNNIDSDIPESCDATTGECLKCQFHTTGFNCEHCMDGYHGDAPQQGCNECICNKLGTDAQVRPPCDRQTGQCPCLRNVIGATCDECVTDHWNLASERGCDACACDADGAIGTRCNLITGQCVCKFDRGGRDCSECKDLYWGDPNIECTLCECHEQGSESNQCDRMTGQCPCKLGITGLKCDRCDRGTTGQLPNCVPCGECYDSWEDEIANVQADQEAVLKRMNNTKSDGGVEVFENEFRDIEKALDEIREIINSTSYVRENLEPLQNLTNMIKNNLTASEKRLKEITQEVRNTSERRDEGSGRITVLQNEVAKLKVAAKELRDNATKVLIDDVEGAYNITVDAKKKSDSAKEKVRNLDDKVQDSNNIRTQVADLIWNNIDKFDKEMKAINGNLTDMDNRVMNLSGRIANINDKVCDGHGEPCDDLCGGGGCDTCGGDSCKGAVTTAREAANIVERAERLLTDKQENLDNQLTQASETKKVTKEAELAAQEAQEEALKLKTEAETSRKVLSDLLDGMKDFMGEDGATADDIEKISKAVLAMEISLTPDQIKDLAKKIRHTLAKIQDVGKIIDDTKDNVALAQQLKERANNASKEAGASLSVAEDVLKALDGASQAQINADAAIAEAEANITLARSDIQQIEAESKIALNKSKTADALVDVLEKKLIDVKKRFTANELNIQKARDSADEAISLADKAEKGYNELEGKYAKMATRLDGKHNKTGTARIRADRLREKATRMAGELADKYKKLQDHMTKSEQNELEIVNIQKTVDELMDEMIKYSNDITARSKEYADCTPNQS